MAGKQVHAEFAERFKRALDEAGFGKFKQKELAELFGVTSQAVRKWVEGEAMPASTRALAVANILGVRRSWLLDDELPMRAINLDMAELPPGYAAQGDSLSISAAEFRLLSRYRQLPRGLQDTLLVLLEQMSKDQPGS